MPETETKKYDVIIIGAGPAGLAAAIYTLRKELSTLIVSEDVGGQVIITNEVENYPGVDLVTGPQLMTTFRKQVEKFGGQFVLTRATTIKQQADNSFVVKTRDAEYQSLVVILAFGLTPRSLGVPGEDQFKGRGVAFCATCDAPFYKDKIAAVVGGGNSAVEAAEELSRVAKKVYLIHRRDIFNADQILIDKLPELKNLEMFLNSEILEFRGDLKLRQIVVHDRTGAKADFTLDVDGTFLEIGYITQTDWIRDVVDLNERGEIVVDDKNQTSRTGVFAAGDVTTLAFKQIVISAGEGAKAALTASQYISRTTGRVAVPDWGKKKK